VADDAEEQASSCSFFFFLAIFPTSSALTVNIGQDL
jgi:hypothetical protein